MFAPLIYTISHTSGVEFERTKMLHKLVDWIVSVPGTDAQHRWQFDANWKKSRVLEKSLITAHDETRLFKKKAEESMSQALQLISSGNWEIEKTAKDGIIYCQKHPEHGKIFKFVGYVNIPAKKLNDILFCDVENSPKWNKNLKKAKVLKMIDHCTNIAQYICVNMPLITCRDFIHLRHWKENGDGFVHSCVSVDYKDAPEPKDCVRGEQAFCTYVMNPVPGEPNKCQVVWLMQTNFKGWFPQYVIDRTICFGMSNYVTYLNSLKTHI